MSMTHRIVLCIGIVLLDLVIFFIPLSAFFLAYILLVNPPWFRQYLQKLDPAKPLS